MKQGQKYYQNGNIPKILHLFDILDYFDILPSINEGDFKTVAMTQF